MTREMTDRIILFSSTNGERGFVTGLEEFSAISHFFRKGKETILDRIPNKTEPFV